MREGTLTRALALVLCGGCAQILGIHDRGENSGSNGGQETPSCTGQPATCGPNGDESCCLSLPVPGGVFYREYDASMASPASYNKATLSPYLLDKYDVTVGRFRAFVEAGFGTQDNPPAPGSGEHPHLPGSGWNPADEIALPANKTAFLQSLGPTQCMMGTWTPAAADHEHRAMNCMRWVDAMAFCIWDGGYLPTEAEWAFAASGGPKQRVYPWSVPDYDLTTGTSYAVYNVPSVVDVGTKPAGDGLYGQSDLNGNVEMFVLDWADSVVNTPNCVDCAYLTGMETRQLVGGSYMNAAAAKIVGSDMSGQGQDFGSPLSGFRCARAAP